MNGEPIDNETILSDIIDVFKKHNIPINTLLLNISLLDDDFGNTFPSLKAFKQGRYYRHQTVNDIPATIEAQRRFPFDAITQWMTSNVQSFTSELTDRIASEHPDIKTRFNTKQGENHLGKFYNIEIECRYESEPKPVIFSIWVNQKDGSSYPQVSSFVAWVINDLGGDNRELDMVLDTPRQEIQHTATLERHFSTDNLAHLSTTFMQECETLTNGKP